MQVFEISSDKEFDWYEDKPFYKKNVKKYSSIDDIFTKNKEMLSKIGVVHSHRDNFIPHPDPNQRRKNNYENLTKKIEKASGERPFLVRTRHDEIHDGVDRFNKLTGIDWYELPDEEKMALLEDGSALKDIVQEHVNKNREKLKQEYGFSDEYLNDAINHVWFSLSQWNNWKKEWQGVPGCRHGDAADNPRNLMRHFYSFGMRVVPKTFLRLVSACF